MHLALDHRAEPGPDAVPQPARMGGGAAPSSERGNRYARWALHQGLGEGDAVALLMRDLPDLPAIRRGLDAVGVRTPMLDAALRGAALARSLDAAEPRHLFVDARLAEALCSIQGLVRVLPAVWWHGGADFARIDLDVAEYDGGPLDPWEIALRRR